jgi:hypothetical protein
MKKFLLFLMIASFALGIHAQSKDKNRMTMRIVSCKVTDPGMLQTAIEQEAQGNTRPKLFLETLSTIARDKLDEAAKISGRFELSDEQTLEALSSDAQDRVFMNLNRSERVSYISSHQNDYAMNCDVNKCSFMRRAGGAGWQCDIRIKVDIYQAHDPAAPAILSREIASVMKYTNIRAKRDMAFQDAFNTMMASLVTLLVENIPIYGLLDFDGTNYTVNCGEDLNISTKDNFTVIYTRYEGDKANREVVGNASVEEVLPESSVIKLKDGKDKILAIVPTLDLNSFLQCRIMLDRKLTPKILEDEYGVSASGNVVKKRDTKRDIRK